MSDTANNLAAGLKAAFDALGAQIKAGADAQIASATQVLAKLEKVDEKVGSQAVTIGQLMEKTKNLEEAKTTHAADIADLKQTSNRVLGAALLISALLPILIKLLWH